MNLLTHNLISEEMQMRFEALKAAPVTILQIGEGNFLRGFFDWMIHTCRQQGLYEGSIAVTQPRPGGKPKIEALAAQDGLYHLVIRGLEEGQPVERTELVQVFSQVFDPYSEWDRLLTLAASPDLQIIVSNTTEAGLIYRSEPLVEGQPIQSYPGKLAKLLHHRFETFGGDPQRGLVCLPCELLERNGDTLRECVLRYSEDWGYSESFKQWVVKHNRFVNSLVDRIVTGYPEESQAAAWFEEWGYQDSMLTTSEPYHLWAIEAELEMEKLLPLRTAGLNVHWVQELAPYQLRKVRILNGSHTLMTPLGLVLGQEYVRAAMEHPELGELVRHTVEQEIIPALPIEQEELRQYANDVYERFLNPFINHRLSDIAMNSLSKFKVRLLPVLMDYIKQDKGLPDGLVMGLAGLLRYYKVQKSDAGFVGTTLAGADYVVRDDAALLEKIAEVWQASNEEYFQQQSLQNQAQQIGIIRRESHDSQQVGLQETSSLQAAIEKLLGMAALWGCDLTELSPELAAAVCAKLDEMERYTHE